MKAGFGILVVAVGWLAATLASAAAAREVPLPANEAIPIVLLVDLSSGQTLYSRNADRRFVPASVTKAMTAYTAFELLARGRLAPDQRFTFSPSAAEQWQNTGSTMFLRAGDETPVSNLLRAITTVSANDGSIVLAEGAAGSVETWVAQMNANAATLGMRQSHFGTPNGWPDNARTFTTARDLVKLGTALVARHPTLYAEYFGHRGMVTNGVAQDNHEPLTGRVDGADGIKTGFTRQAGHNVLGSAVRGGRRLMMVLAGAPEQAIRDNSARSLMEWGFDNFRSQRLFGKETVIGMARVQNGAAGTVPLVSQEPVLVSQSADGTGKLSLAIRYEGPLRAPIAAGEEVAKLQISAPGMEPVLVPLMAGTEVAEAGFFRRISNAFAGLFS